MRNLYEAVGVPLDKIKKYFIPHQRSMLLSIDYWFTQYYNQPKLSYDLGELHRLLEGLKYTTDAFISNYFNNINMVVIGDGNRATGKKVFISGDNMNVNGNNAYIYNSNAVDNTVRGNNIIRTQNY